MKSFTTKFSDKILSERIITALVILILSFVLITLGNYVKLGLTINNHIILFIKDNFIK